MAQAASGGKAIKLRMKIICITGYVAISHFAPVSITPKRKTAMLTDTIPKLVLPGTKLEIIIFHQ
jgi:hypothetical protein